MDNNLKAVTLKFWCNGFLFVSNDEIMTKQEIMDMKRIHLSSKIKKYPF